MTIAPGPEIWFRAVGTALAGASVLFAGYMMAFGEGKVRINGIDHLAIFAQPHGQPPTGVTAIARSEANEPFDARPEASAGREDDTGAPQRPARIVAARPDRVWLMIGGVIRSAGPRDDVPGVGRIGAIVQREGTWALVDDKGATLLTAAKEANGAQLFSRRLIFE